MKDEKSSERVPFCEAGKLRRDLVRDPAELRHVAKRAFTVRGQSDSVRLVPLRRVMSSISSNESPHISAQSPINKYVVR